MRREQGLLARMQDKVDMTFAEVGCRGGMAQHYRTQGNNLLRRLRLKSKERCLHALAVEGREPSDKIAQETLNDERCRKIYLCPERLEGVFDLYPCCRQSEYRDLMWNMTPCQHFYSGLPFFSRAILG